MGDIGDNPRTYEFEPIEQPASVPEPIRQPVVTPEPELVPV